jgi:predicted AlkP superfamily phosphohydrolase/phosphomutase
VTGDGDLDVLLIGIDAGCRSVFDRLNDEGRIPNLASIYEDGVAGALESQIPPWTPSAWPSLYTGVNPGKHGAYGFVTFDGYDWAVVTRDHVREYAIWELLDEYDRSSVVVNVPVTSPPAKIDGAIVPGFIGPEDPPCHPAGVLEEIEDAIGEYRVYPEYTRGDDDYTAPEKLAEYRRLVEMRREAFSYLVDVHDPDFGFVQFQKPDTVFHEFGGDEDAVNRVYEATDEQIGILLDEHDPDTVFVASDHGIGPYEKQEFRVNEYLKDAGYVETTTGGKGMPSWNPIRQGLREGSNETTWEPNVIERLAGTAAKFGLTANRVGAGLRQVGLEDVAKEYAPDGVVRTANEQVDFASSVAYMRARTELGVRLNVAGREPDGVVPPAEYESVREDVMETLREATAPDGEPVFETVSPREAYYDGPFVEDAVDVVTIPNDFEHFLSAQLLGEHFGEPAEPWNHKLDGIVAARGEAVDESASLAGAHLFDVAPTVLSAFDVPYSERMDGSPLPIVEDVGPASYPSYEGRPSAGSPDRAAVEGRLSDLGYLE